MLRSCGAGSGEHRRTPSNCPTAQSYVAPMRNRVVASGSKQKATNTPRLTRTRRQEMAQQHPFDFDSTVHDETGSERCVAVAGMSQSQNPRCPSERSTLVAGDPVLSPGLFGGLPVDSSLESLWEGSGELSGSRPRRNLLAPFGTLITSSGASSTRTANAKCGKPGPRVRVLL